MAERTVTAARLFELADTISALVNEAGKQVNPQGLITDLTSAMVSVLSAAKNASFNEALEAHNKARATPLAGGDGKETNG